MKKIILALAALTMVFSSCSKDDTANEKMNDNTDQMEIRMSVNSLGMDFSTRSFTDQLTQMTEWEKRMSTYNIYIYDKDGKFIKETSVSHKILSEQGYFLITMPRDYAQTECTFYVSANYDVSGTFRYEESKMLSAVFTYSLDNYNAIDAGNVLDGSALKYYFPFVGSKKVTLSRYGQLTDVDIELQILMNKIAFEFSIDPQFSANHNGSMISITSATLMNVSATSYLFAADVPSSGIINLFQKTQYQQDGRFCHLWYGYQSPGDHTVSPHILLSGIFDKDGDFTTTHDQTSITYTIPVAEYFSTDGLEKGTCYRIKGEIKGLGDNSIITTFSVADWILPDTAEIGIGY